MELESFLPCSQEFATGLRESYPYALKNLLIHFLKIDFN
jgi:hypothetical protein